MMPPANRNNDKKEPKDIKKLVGNPKIIFLMGGPGTGKGAYCQKLVGEFGYTHISMGALFQKEIAKVSFMFLVLLSWIHLFHRVIAQILILILLSRETKKANVSRKLFRMAESSHMK